MTFGHKSVLLAESIDLLKVDGGKGVFVDATLGLGGHSEEILRRLSPEGRLIGLDLDDRNLADARERLKGSGNFKAVKSNFRDLDVVLQNEGIAEIDGILFDLGVSSAHFDDASRGFSFSKDAPLDMRLDPKAQLTAYDVVNSYKRQDLERVIRDYGEEYKYKRIADFIINRRPIESTAKLAEIAALAKRGMKEKINPATQLFQAVRIEVNDELNAMKEALEKALAILKSGGVIAVISFHSLEDRIVKRYFAMEASDCICENKRMPCMCGHVKRINLLTKKAIIPGEAETSENPRSRSAKLRAAVKI
jgi:16S rRNA (cytosine1402-N4)-methyltransferase